MTNEKLEELEKLYTDAIAVGEEIPSLQHGAAIGRLVLELVAEVKRLRKALESIAKINDECLCIAEGCGCATPMFNVAREALRGK
jgi:hypothetical protein